MARTDTLAEAAFRTRRLLGGLLSLLPGGVRRFTPRNVESAERATPLRYYSLWLRHLIFAQRMGLERCPPKVLELGPGDSLGAGLSALLSGAECLYAIDRFKLTSATRSGAMFEALAHLFEHHTPPDLTIDLPHLPANAFPQHLLSPSALNPLRIASLRSQLDSADSGRAHVVRYSAPDDAASSFGEESIDFAFSHSVLEYVEDLQATHRLLFRLLRPGAVVSHFVDYSAIGFARHWDGHWAYSDCEWRLIKGRRPYIVQRHPHSEHVKALQSSGFVDINAERFEASPQTPTKHIAKRFRDLSEEDRRTHYALIQARKPVNRR